MKVADVSFSYDEGVATVEQLLEQHYTITGWTEALQKQGIELMVLKRFSKEDTFQKNNVQYYFIKDKLKGMLKPWHLPLSFINRIKKLDVDVVHVHGFMFPMQILLLKLLLNNKTSIIIQHHGGNSPKGIKGYLYGLMNHLANGFFFTTISQGKEWFSKKKQYNKIMQVMEGSNHFTYCETDIARKATKLKGHPIFLWVGRLDNNKDPLTVLNGFEKVIDKCATALLYMIYSDNYLLNAVEAKINASVKLRQNVHLLGSIANNEMEAYYNSADYFVLGSHHEGSGYALSEALACGCIPIVTRIPSFTMMTDNGRLGSLWQIGNSQSFLEAAAIAMSKNVEIESRNCVDFFKGNLSFEAIASTAIKHYQKVIYARL